LLRQLEDGWRETRSCGDGGIDHGRNGCLE